VSYDIEYLKDEVNSHFGEELKTKKRIHEIEQKIETIAMSVI
jgi:hypothetical protein